MSLASKFGAGNAAELTAPSRNDFSRAGEGTIAPRDLSYHFGSGSVSLTAPTLTWTSAETVDPPEFNIDLTDPQEGDIVRLYRDGVQFDEYTLTADDLASLTFPFGTGPWGNGTFDVYVTHVRGAVESAASDPVAVTIAVPAAYWTPADLATAPAIWVEATDTLSGTAWADKSGNGRNFTATNGPARNATAFGGAPAMVTDGVDDYFRAAWTYTGSAMTYFVAILESGSTANARFVSFTKDGSADWNYPGGTSLADYDAFNWVTFRNGQTGNQFPEAANGSAHIASVVHDGTQRTVRVDGAASTGTDNPVPEGVDPFDFNEVTLGAMGNNSTFAVANFFFFAALPYAATSGDIEKMEGYIAWQAYDAGNTDLVDALPAGHTYKAARP